MPRKGAAPRRVIGPDPVFGNVTVSRLVNKVMQRGKKSLAEHIVYGAFDEVKSKAGQDPAKVLDKALGNIMPLLEVRPRRGGGAPHQGPIVGRPGGREKTAGAWRPNWRRRSWMPPPGRAAP